MKTHPLNISYLVVGLIFLGLAGSWALRESGVVDLGEVEWLLPLTLVVAGVIGLVAFAAKGISGRGRHADHTGDEGYEDTLPGTYPDSYYDTDSEGETR